MGRRDVPTSRRWSGVFDWRNPMSWIRLTALRRGLLGGSGGWTVVAVLVWLPRLWRRLVARQPEQLATRALRPGESLSITTSAPGRRRRRA